MNPRIIASILLLSCSLWAQAPVDMIEHSQAMSGVAGSHGSGLRVYSDGRVEQFEFQNGHSTVTSTRQLDPQQAQTLIRQLNELPLAITAPTSGGSSRSLLIKIAGKTRSNFYKPENQSAVNQILQPAFRSLPPTNPEAK